jgi:hypothetical protein
MRGPPWGRPSLHTRTGSWHLVWPRPHARITLHPDDLVAQVAGLSPYERADALHWQRARAGYDPLYESLGVVDAAVCAAGVTPFKPLGDLAGVGYIDQPSDG